MIYRLSDAGVREPEPINFVEGVLVMELVRDTAGDPAPRLGDLSYSAAEAREIYDQLIREVVRMLCAGVVHGDLSDFNVLMSDQGPVVIDFPQSVDPTHNPNGKKLLLRDVENLHRFLARFAPDEPILPLGEEIWSLFEANRLRPDTKLTGRHAGPKGKVDTTEVMALIEDARRESQSQRGPRDEDDVDASEESDEAAAPSVADAVAPVSPRRRVVDFSAERSHAKPGKKRARKAPAAHPDRRRQASTEERVPPSGPAQGTVAKSGPSSSNRRRRRGGQAAPAASEARATQGESPAAGSDRPTDPQKRRRTRSRNRRGRADAGPTARSSSEQAKRGADSRREVGARAGKPARGGSSEAAPQESDRAARRPAERQTSTGADSKRREQGEQNRPRRRRTRRPRKGGAGS
jgi:RIO kinase 1